MGYIVDLTIVMHRLSTMEISEANVIAVLESYATSREIAQVHNDIRTFSSHSQHSEYMNTMKFMVIN